MIEYKLGDICSIQAGGTPKRSNVKYYNSAFIPWAKVGDLQGDQEINKTEETISEEGLISIGNRVFEKGTLLVAMYGSVGKTAIAGIQLSCNQAIVGINSKDDSILNNVYLKYWFDYNKRRLMFKSKGGILKNLNAKFINQLMIQIPAIEIQNEIVVNLNSIQTYISKRQSSISLLDEYMESFFLEAFGHPILNLKKWKTKKLKELGNWQSGGTPPRKSPKYFQNGEIPWFSSGELNDIYISESYEKITKSAIEETNAKLVSEGSLMIGMYDTAALKTSITKIDCSCNQAIASSKLIKDVNTLFVLFCLKIGKKFYLDKRKGARQKNLNLTFIKNIDVITPSLELQEKFESIYLIIESQKIKFFKSLELFNELFQAAIHQAFNIKTSTVDEIEFLINDAIALEVFLNSINSRDFQNDELYTVEIEKLFEILDKTDQKNIEDISYKKGIVQRIKNGKIILESNVEYKNRLIDEAIKN